MQKRLAIGRGGGGGGVQRTPPASLRVNISKNFQFDLF